MNTLKMLFGCACLIAVFNAQPAHAQVVAFTDRTSFDSVYPGASQEGWDSYAAGTTITNGSLFNGITYQTNSSNPAEVVTAYIDTTDPNSLGINNPENFLSFGPTDTITFSFAQPLSAFSIDVNTFSTTAGDYTATLSNGGIANSVFDAFPESPYDSGQFIGFSDATSFDSVTIADNGPYSYTLDTLQSVPFGGIGPKTSAVPEPSTVALMIIGLFGIAGFSLSRKFTFGK